MKKIIIAASAALLATTAIANAQEATTTTTNPEFFFKPEIGIDISHSLVDIDKNYDYLYDDNVNTIGLALGARIHKNIGFELNMAQSSNGRKNLESVFTKFDYKTIGLDANFYHEVAPKAEVFATLGAKYFDFNTSASNSAVTMEYKDNTIAPKIGAGLSYKLNDKMAVKTSVDHTFVNHFDVSSATDFRVGLRYAF